MIFLSASSTQSSCNSGAEYSITAARAHNLRGANSFRRTIESNYIIGSYLLVCRVRSCRSNRVLVPRARLMSCGTMQRADTRRLHTGERYTYVSISLSFFLSFSICRPRLGAVSCIKFLQQATVSDACTQIRNIPSGMYSYLERTSSP